jgi:hypothetical protein
MHLLQCAAQRFGTRTAWFNNLHGAPLVDGRSASGN